MRRQLAVLAALVSVFTAPAAIADPATAPACKSSTALGVSRIVEIDTSTGALFGAISKQTKEPRFLEPKEVILTFDDGPLPMITRSILDTLDQFCTKATFFEVGEMAIAYPSTVKSVIARGHTVGTHTWSHPLNLRHLSREKATDEIEKGFAAVTLAAGQPVAPFFRFPGLSDSGGLLAHLQERGIASFTVDSVSNDSYISDPQRLLQHALAEVEAQKGGIVLFHDIKSATARMLPRFLTELHERGYKVVHIVPKGHVEPLPAYRQDLEARLEKSLKTPAAGALVPFYGVLKPAVLAAAGPAADPDVTAITPAARERTEPPNGKAKLAERTTVAHKSDNASSRTAARGWAKRSPPKSDPN